MLSPPFPAFLIAYPLFLPTLGFGELAIVFVIVLILFGPGKLPSVAKALGEGIRQFKHATKEVTKEVSSDHEPSTSSPEPSVHAKKETD